MRNTKTEIKRVIIPVVLLVLSSLFVFADADKILLFRVILKWSLGLLLTHFSWMMIFGCYIDTKFVLQNDSSKFVGVAILRGLYYLASMLAFAIML